MQEFIDRVPAKGKSGRRKITYDNGQIEYVVIETADDASPTGTKINRKNLMALQGFEAKTTVFSEDGSTITETNTDGHTLTTVFDDDGSITETFVGVKTIIKTTTFNEDGSITEVIS